MSYNVANVLFRHLYHLKVSNINHIIICGEYNSIIACLALACIRLKLTLKAPRKNVSENVVC